LEFIASNNLFPDSPIVPEPAAAPSMPIYNRPPATKEEQRGATARQPRPDNKKNNQKNKRSSFRLIQDGFHTEVDRKSNL